MDCLKKKIINIIPVAKIRFCFKNLTARPTADQGCWKDWSGINW